MTDRPATMASLQTRPNPARMPGETQLHRTLKAEACRWLFRMGYSCIAAEVPLEPIGVVDALGAGLFGGWANRLGQPKPLHQVCLIECKASRSDFLRDFGDAANLVAVAAAGRRPTRPIKSRRRSRSCRELGKFASCVAYPMANLHYVLAPAGIVTAADLLPGWGLLAMGASGIVETVQAAWVADARTTDIEGRIARTLTADIFRADERAIRSVNRSIMLRQEELARKLRSIAPKPARTPANQ